MTINHNCEGICTYFLYFQYSLTIDLFIILIVAIVLNYLRCVWKYRHLYIKSFKIPGPLYLPIIGSGHLFLRNPRGYMNLFERMSKKYPKLFKIWGVGFDVHYILIEPEFIEKTLTSPFAMEKHTFYKSLAQVLGYGLVAATRSVWKPHRKALSPGFNKHILHSYVKLFATSSTEFTEILKQLVGKKDVDWDILSTRFALDTACKSTMGINLKLLHNEPRDEDLGDTLRNLNILGTRRVFHAWNQVGIIYKYSRIKKCFDRYVSIFNKLITSVVQQKREKYESNKEIDKSEIAAPSKSLDLLERMLQNPIFSEKELVHQVKTFLAAATDTTGLTISAVFIMLGMFPQLQEQVYKEVTEVIGHHREVEASDLSQLNYTERVIQETLRLFPPVQMFGRKCTKDINLGSFVIPKDALIAILPHLIHRDPNYWKDPLRFDPDRFLPEESSKRPPGSYIPFSYGPRNCIGFQFAMLNLKTIVSTVVRELKIFTTYKSVEEVEVSLNPMLKLPKGINIWFEQRE